MNDFEDPNSPSEFGATAHEEKKMYSTEFDNDFLKADLVSIASTSMNRGFGQKTARRGIAQSKMPSPIRNSRVNRNQST
jgi:hypothetical protein